MADQNDLEIYKQRYETYRHLDRLRWLMFAAAVGVVALFLLFNGVRFGSVGWLVLGGLLLSLGAAKLRIGLQAAEITEALSAFAQPTQDAEETPETPRQGASFWFGRMLTAFGVGCFPCAAHLLHRQPLRRGRAFHHMALERVGVRGRFSDLRRTCEAAHRQSERGDFRSPRAKVRLTGLPLLWRGSGVC